MAVNRLGEKMYLRKTRVSDSPAPARAEPRAARHAHSRVHQLAHVRLRPLCVVQQLARGVVLDHLAVLVRLLGGHPLGQQRAHRARVRGVRRLQLCGGV